MRIVFGVVLSLGFCLQPVIAGDTQTSDASSDIDLAQYEGQYEYENGTTLIMVAGPHNEILYASINGAHYPLRPVGSDVFLNNGDVEVVFVRGDNGEIIGYREKRLSTLESNPLFRLLDRTKRLSPAIWHAKPLDAPNRYAYHAPEETEDGLPVSALSAEDPLLERLTAMTTAIYADSFPGVESVLLYRDGALVFEEYFYGFDRDTPHQLRSATKSLMSLVVGAAVDSGQIASVDEKVLPYFSQYQDLQHVDDRKRSLTLHHLLTMQSGFDCNDWQESSPGNENRMIYAEDWTRFMLDLPMASEPGTQGAYCSGNVVLAGRILEKAVGMPLREYADSVLFEPLGITDYEWDFRPDPSNVTNYTQAWLKPRDMIKIGVLLADNGVWRGEPVLSPEWIAAMKSTQSRISGTPYGYFFWRRYFVKNGQRVETPQVSGNGGQKIILLKPQNAILVLTGGGYNQQSHTNDLLAEFVLPGLAPGNKELDGRQP